MIITFLTIVLILTLLLLMQMYSHAISCFIKLSWGGWGNTVLTDYAYCPPPPCYAIGLNVNRDKFNWLVEYHSSMFNYSDSRGLSVCIVPPNLMLHIDAVETNQHIISPQHKYIPQSWFKVPSINTSHSHDSRSQHKYIPQSWFKILA